MDKELQNLLDNYEQAIYGYTEPIIPSIHQIHLLLDYVSQLDIKVKKQKEVIDRIDKYIKENIYSYYDSKGEKCIEETVFERNANPKELLDILKEV